jgi:hypothetical protein
MITLVVSSAGCGNKKASTDRTATVSASATWTTVTGVSSVVSSPEGQPASAPTYDLQQLPKASAPYGLSSLRLPETEADIAAVLARLPNSLDGWNVERVPTPPRGFLAVEYHAATDDQAPMAIQARNIPVSDPSIANWTAGQLIANELAGSQADGAQGGRDGELLWAERQAGAITLIWGRADSKWVFVAIAGTSQQLEQLLSALTTAVTD